jgi:MYXO-CTERM domain-containing protein
MLARKVLLLGTLLTGSATTLSASPFWEQWTARIPCMAFQSAVCPDILLQSRTSSTGSLFTITIRNQPLTPDRYTDFTLFAPGPPPGDEYFLALGLRGPSGFDLAGANGINAFHPQAQVLTGQYSDGGASMRVRCGNFTFDPDAVGYFGSCEQGGLGGATTYFYRILTQVRLPDLVHARFYNPANGIDFFFDNQSEPGTDPYPPGDICQDALVCSVTVAPEPSTWVLAGTGLALIAAVRVARKRRSSRT